MGSTTDDTAAGEPTLHPRQRDVPVPDGFDITRFLSGRAAQLSGAANVIMQLGLPQVGYGVMNSRVIDGAIMHHPFKRARTTFTYIAVALLGSDEERAAYRRAVGRQHRQVVSRDDEPVQYRAMDPRLQTWVAACMYYGARDMHERMVGPLDAEYSRGLYCACAKFGTTLQMPADAWPADEAAFDAYWQASLAQVRIDPPVREYLTQIMTLQFLPRWLGRSAKSSVFMTTGLLPPQFREQMGLSWSDEQQARLDTILRRQGRLDRRMPRALRMFPFNLLLWDLRRRMRKGLPLV